MLQISRIADFGCPNRSRTTLDGFSPACVKLLLKEKTKRNETRRLCILVPSILLTARVNTLWQFHENNLSTLVDLYLVYGMPRTQFLLVVDSKRNGQSDFRSTCPGIPVLKKISNRRFQAIPAVFSRCRDFHGGPAQAMTALQCLRCY